MQERLPKVQGGIKACYPWQLDSATAPCVALTPASLQSSGIPCRNDELYLYLATLVRGMLPSLGGFG
jgi:hypothetical protein